MPSDDFQLRRRGDARNLGRGGADSGYTGVPGPDFGLDDGLMSVEDGSMASQLHLTRAHPEHERYPDQVVIDGPVESIMLDEMDEVGAVAYEKPAPIIDQPRHVHPHHKPPQTGITMEEAFNRHIQSQDQGASITHHPSTPRSTTQPTYLGQATPPGLNNQTLHDLGLIQFQQDLVRSRNGTDLSMDARSPGIIFDRALQRTKRSCIYRFRIRMPEVAPPAQAPSGPSEEDLEQMLQALGRLAETRTDDPPSAGRLWERLFGQGQGPRLGRRVGNPLLLTNELGEVVGIVRLEGMWSHLPEPCFFWMQLSLIWWRGEYPGEDGGTTGHVGAIGGFGIEPSADDTPEPTRPIFPSGEESDEWVRECDDWARKYIAWLKAWLKTKNYPPRSVFVRYCGGRRYVFVVADHVDENGRPEVNVHHYKPIPGLGAGSSGPPPGSTTGPVKVDDPSSQWPDEQGQPGCPQTAPTVVTTSGNRLSPSRKMQVHLEGVVPVWAEATFREYMERILDRGSGDPIVKAYQKRLDTFQHECEIDASGARRPGRGVLLVPYNHRMETIRLRDADVWGSGVRAVCYECSGPCPPNTKCEPFQGDPMGESDVVCDCI